MKTVKVELTLEQEDGSRLTQILEGEDATTWQQWIETACLHAWNHGTHLHWNKLHWVVQKDRIAEGGATYN